MSCEIVLKASVTLRVARIDDPRVTIEVTTAAGEATVIALMGKDSTINLELTLPVELARQTGETAQQHSDRIGFMVVPGQGGLA